MHSALHTEVRLSSRLIKTTSRYCKKRSQSPNRQLHCVSGLRSPQGPPNHIKTNTTSSSQKPIDLTDKVGSKSEPRRGTKSESTGEEKNNTSPTGPPTSGVDQAQGQGFYGSSSRRRLRSRLLKDIDPNPLAPEWFLENNIIPRGDTKLTHDAPSHIRLVISDWKTGDLVFNEDPSTGEVKHAITSGAFGGDPVESKLLHKDSQPISAPTGTEPLTEQKPLSEDGKSGKKTGPRYSLVLDQYREVLRTARGLLQINDSPDLTHGSSSSKADLQLHYAGKDGDILLENLVQTLAGDLNTNYVSLDAQDVSELISGSSERPEITAEGRTLSYEVYNDVYEDNAESLAVESFTYEDDEETDGTDNFESFNPTSSMGMPVIIGKPITIDLKNMFGSRFGGGRSDESVFPKSLLSDMFRDASSKSKTQSNVFAVLVESILNGLLHEKLQSLSKFPSNSSQKTTIIHIQGYKAIAEVPVGKQFLAELSEQVNRKRHSGETPIVVIGTDNIRGDQQAFNVPRIEEIQRGRQDETSRSIVLTPVLSDTSSKIALLQDRKQRIAAINLRHLWTMTASLQPSLFPQFDSGFWKKDFIHKLGQEDYPILESHIWNMSYVHRLATWLGGTSLQFQDPDSVSKSGKTQSSEAPFFKDIKQNVDDQFSHSSIRSAAEGLKRSDRTKMRWAEKQNSSRIEIAQRLKPPEDARLSKIRASTTKYEKRLMNGVIEAENISTTFNDVHVPVDTIDALQTLTTLSLVRPEAFKYGVLASDRIPGLLLYGPPGTGKTLLAKAVAKESGATVLEVSGADINDMYVGEGEKNVKALFSLAKKLSPCVVFLDEADAIFSARSNSGRRVSHRELLNQFLREWDGMSNDSSSAFLMVATNRPMDLDDAVLRRLPRRLLVDLPTEPDRLEILRIHLRHEKLAEDVSLPTIASKTPFYSGSDLKNVAVAAALNAVREENDLAKQYKGEQPYKHPERRTLTAKNFDTALDEISASISEDMASLREIKKFDEQYGDRKGRKRKPAKWGFRTAAEADRVLDTVKVRS